jgi:hypothetical protein
VSKSSDKRESAQAPNPGSEMAQKLGCTCAVMDNNHGKYPPYPPDGWWITGGCPLHAPQREAASTLSA